MNKLVIFSCLFVAIISLCTQTADNVTVKSCNGSALSEGEKLANATACCYTTYKSGDKTVKQCLPYNKSQVPELVKKNPNNLQKLSVDCSSNWVSYSLFLVALIFMI